MAYLRASAVENTDSKHAMILQNTHRRADLIESREPLGYWAVCNSSSRSPKHQKIKEPRYLQRLRLSQRSRRVKQASGG